VTRSLLLLGLAIAASGCDVIEQPSGLIPRWTSAWRQVASEDDRERLRDWRATFQKALTAARRAGHSTQIAREGALLDPDAAIGGAAIPNGLYRCRVIKLGANAEGMLDYVTYPAFTCRVRPQRDLQRLEKLSGSQRYVGVLFPQDAIRMVFLGTLVLGDERRAMQYRQDPTRDVAGHLERVGENRWRLVMPRPRFESQLDVTELVPSSQEAPR
jgi:hypothetical protein